MKKLMIVACAIALAAGVQAATCNWAAKTSAGTSIYEAGSDYGSAFSGTAYLFCSTTGLGQEDVLTAWRGGSDISTLGGDALTVSDGAIAQTAFTKDMTGGSEYSWFLAVYDSASSQLFLSDTVLKTATTMPEPSVLEFDCDYGSGDNETLYGDLTWTAASAEGNGGGYFTNVPEPTSGLLLLLGMAGLALRRRRA